MQADLNWKAMLAVLGVLMAALCVVLPMASRKGLETMCSALAIVSYVVFVLLSVGGLL